ncbi:MULTISPECIES: D-amino-acid transaminase [Psychrobacillus]|uniref:D-alanine aminotransferase n=1 Tax=Psychrobacillus faecigallinarum TaxID=2762235 RepID=A0ABR8R6N8_9BACI|nr:MULTISPECIES: D-amino-acid transaminase [Psychrobacillus]MBD7943468.1 D-amino-acid transaminase [Psychrobacillus faecigallinarum]QEY22629.1 D-amino-acid transaminase [Psychrobacillus sp. AK 1817]QGM29501.1 D-amino-acid transaminase [Bacillus sp. N3536]
MTKILWNDQIVEEKEVKIGFEDRGYQFGDGIYEVIKIYNGDLFTATEHIDRLYASADKIQLVMPYTKDKLHQLMHELIETNELQNGQIYLQVTRGNSPRIHNFPNPAVSSVLTAYTKETTRPLAQLESGVKACFVEDIRWLRCDIKSLNLLGNVLAKQEAVTKDCFEAILHRGETVTEGSSSNMYGIKDGVLYTHPVSNLILNGITRKVILDCCEEIGLPIVEKAMTKEETLQMDEFIMSSTNAEVMPIISIDDKAIGDGKPGEFTRKLQKAFEQKIPSTLQV